MEILEQLRLLKQLFSYGLVGEIVIAAGILITFFYQRQKTGSLETQIKSQKGILESAEVFLKLFDLEKLKGYTEVREEKVRAEKELEIETIKRELNEVKEQQFREHFTAEFIAKEYFGLLGAYIEALIYLPNYARRAFFDSIAEGSVKEFTRESIEKLEEIEPRNTLRGLFSEPTLSRFLKEIAGKKREGGEPN